MADAEKTADTLPNVEAGPDVDEVGPLQAAMAELIRLNLLNIPKTRSECPVDD